MNELNKELILSYSNILVENNTSGLIYMLKYEQLDVLIFLIF